jgi:hypothetical protein
MQRRPLSLSILAWFLIFVVVEVVLYWVLFFFFPGVVRTSQEECYLVFERAFPLADAWMAIASIIGAIGIWRMKQWGLLFAIMAGSSAIFLGLMDLLYNVQNEVYLNLTSEVIIEIIINIECLVIPPLAIAYLWRKRRLFGL